MALPDAVLVSDALVPGGKLPYAAETAGVPINGNNVIGLPFVAAGIDPALIQGSRLRIYVESDPNRPVGGSLNPGVEDAKFVSVSPDGTQLTLSFSQTAAGVARVVVEVLHTIEGTGGEAGPIMVLSGFGSGGGGGGAATEAPVVVQAFNYAGVVAAGDVVYKNTVANEVARANASAFSTGRPAGVVRAVDVPAVGQCEVVSLGEVTGFAGLSIGKQYILGAADGAIVAEDDTVNVNYPDTSQGSGHALALVGVASAADKLFVNLDGIRVVF